MEIIKKFFGGKDNRKATIKLKGIRLLQKQIPKEDKNSSANAKQEIKIVHTSSFAQILLISDKEFIKIIQLKGEDNKYAAQIGRTLSRLEQVQKYCNNILPFKLVFWSERQIEQQTYTNIIIELNKFGIGLDQYMRQNDKISQKEATKIIKQLAYGYKELIDHHNKKLLTVRPSNIRILANNGNIKVKIADYGLCQIVGHKHTQAQNIQQQLVFNSPQANSEKKYTQQNIVWGLGVLYYFLLSNFLGKKYNSYQKFLQILGQNKLEDQVHRLSATSQVIQLVAKMLKPENERTNFDTIAFNFQKQDAKKQYNVVGKLSGKSSRKPSSYLPKEYKLSQLRSRGNFGKVFKCGKYAVKMIDVRGQTSEQINQQNMQINILSSIDHKNIIKLHEYFQQDEKLYLVMDWCKIDLYDYLSGSQGGKINEKTAIFIFKQILDGYRELRQNNIIHRDLKPNNILIKDEKLVKIADFGFSKILDDFDNDILNNRAGTYAYMPPQILKKIQHTSKSEIWSLGVTFYKMLFGHTPWKGSTKTQILQNIETKELTFPDNDVSENSKQLIKRMLKINQSERIGWDQLFKQADNLTIEIKSNLRINRCSFLSCF